MDFESIKARFEEKTGLAGIDSEIRETGEAGVLILYVANPTERLYSTLEAVRHEGLAQEEEAPLATLTRAGRRNLITTAEGKLLLRTLSESQNINRHSCKEDFFSRYTKSVFGAATSPRLE